MILCHYQCHLTHYTLIKSVIDIKILNSEALICFWNFSARLIFNQKVQLKSLAMMSMIIYASYAALSAPMEGEQFV